MVHTNIEILVNGIGAMGYPGTFLLMTYIWFQRHKAAIASVSADSGSGT